VAQTPEEEEPPHHRPKKYKPPIEIHRQTETTSGRSEELIYEEENYPETVVGDPIANKIETDEKISTVARLLKEKKEREGKEENGEEEDDDPRDAEEPYWEEIGNPTPKPKIAPVCTKAAPSSIEDKATLMDDDEFPNKHDPNPKYSEVIAWYRFKTSWICDAKGLQNIKIPMNKHSPRMGGRKLYPEMGEEGMRVSRYVLTYKPDASDVYTALNFAHIYGVERLNKLNFEAVADVRAIYGSMRADEAAALVISGGR